MVVTVCKKCGKTSNALFSGICDKCFHKKQKIEKIIRLCPGSLHCLRCNHFWLPRHRKVKPVCCPACKSPYWNVPYKKKNIKIMKAKEKLRAIYINLPHPRLQPQLDKKLLESYPTRAQYFKEKYG